MVYKILQLGTLTHNLPEIEDQPARVVHETYVVFACWESKELADAGEAPHLIEDIHAQNHRLLNHPVSPLQDIHEIINWHYNHPNHVGRRGDFRNPALMHAATNADPHGILANPNKQGAKP